MHFSSKIPNQRTGKLLQWALMNISPVFLFITFPLENLNEDSAQQLLSKHKPRQCDALEKTSNFYKVTKCPSKNA